MRTAALRAPGYAHWGIGNALLKLLRSVLPLAVATVLLLHTPGCGGETDSARGVDHVYSAAEVERAFASERVDLTRVFDLPNAEMKSLYAGHADDAGNLFFVAIFGDADAAQMHETSNSSPTSTDASISREQNVVVYIPTTASVTAVGHVNGAIRRLRSLP